jgi:zinc transport system permease protein
MMIPEIFQYEFMVRAFLAGSVIAVIAPLIGTHLVVRQYSMMFDTLAHVALAGVAIGLLFHTEPVPTAVVVTVLAAIAIDQLRSTRRIFGESALAIFLSGGLAVAVVLISLADGLNVDLLSFLFGSITTVSSTDLAYIFGLGVVVVLASLMLYKEFFLISFDEEIAKAGGLPVRLLNIVSVVLAAVTVGLAMRVVGALLIGALMVVPVVTAIQFNRSFRVTTVIAIGMSLLAVFVGLVLSYYLDLASGGTIVVVSLAFFLVSLLLGRRR